MEDCIEALRWFVNNDNTYDIASNYYWIKGLENARELLAKYDKVPYKPLDWMVFDALAALKISKPDASLKDLEDILYSLSDYDIEELAKSL